MGNRESQLTKEELKDYEELTCLTKNEIVHAFSRFKAIDRTSVNADKYARIPFRVIKRIPELQNNPFADRIGRVFSSEDDDSWSFEDFLDMVSVFSASAATKKKIEYAFRIYDFDNDGYLSAEDIARMATMLIGSSNRLTRAEMKILLDKILKEADVDKDGMLSPAEFEHFMMTSRDFASSFTVRL